MIDNVLGPEFIAVLVIALLVVKELAAASMKHNWRLFARYLNVALVPLLVIFFINIAFKMIKLIR